MTDINIHNELQKQFGFDEFRPGQAQTITQLLNAQSSLAIFPTGSGKSMCYQLTATLLPHLTLVVSPLLALMKDQLSFLAKHNIEAASIDSSISAQQSAQIMQDVRSGKIKILMVSVERFKNERFRGFISDVAISMLVIDEAHCISEWGHNFRPDYLKLPSYQQTLKIPLVLLLTATATAGVKNDMAKKFAITEQHIVQTGFYRHNLDLSIEALSSAQKGGRLIELIRHHHHNQSQQSSAGIVYVTLQKTAEHVAAFLQAKGVKACAYHAGLADDKRQVIQQDFMANKFDVVVATIAFGMGIDKSDIRFVIHYDLPKSIENYSQEIGRAGRDDNPSFCYTLANLDSLNTLENFVYGDTPEHASICSVIEDIQEKSINQQWEMQLYGLSNASNIRQLTLKTLLVQLELMGVLQAKYSYFAEFKIKLCVSKEQLLSGFNLQRQQFLGQIFEHTQFKKVWGSLSFDSLYTAYQSDRSKVVAALEYLADKQLIELQTNQMTDVYGVDLTKMNAGLATQIHNYFSEKENKEILRINALVEFFEQPTCLSYNLACYFDDKNIQQQGFNNTQHKQQCGHCSACRGNRVKLAYSEQHTWPEIEVLNSYLQTFKQAWLSQSEQTLSVAIFCRFLAGISLPVFTKIKARKLAGFGCCENFRYQQILTRVAPLMP